MPERANQHRVLSLDLKSIPVSNSYLDYYLKYGFKIPDEERALATHLPPSTKAVLIKCNYSIDV